MNFVSSLLNTMSRPSSQQQEPPAIEPTKVETNPDDNPADFQDAIEPGQAFTTTTEVEDLNVPAGAPRVVVRKVVLSKADLLIPFDHVHPGSKCRTFLVGDVQYVSPRDLLMAGAQKDWGDKTSEKNGSNLWDRNKAWFNETYPGIVKQHLFSGDPCCLASVPCIFP